MKKRPEYPAELLQRAAKERGVSIGQIVRKRGFDKASVRKALAGEGRTVRVLAGVARELGLRLTFVPMGDGDGK